MRKQTLKTVNQTFSLPTDLSAELHAYVKHREMSRFVADAVRDKLKSKKEELSKAYRMANKDAGQKEAAEWEGTLADGADNW